MTSTRQTVLPELRSILAATDFSRSAGVAVRRAAQLAGAAGARLELVHVLPAEPPVPTSWTALRGALGVDPARARDDALARLRRAAGPLQAGLRSPLEFRVASGRAHAAIASRAVEIAADLVVVGAHGENFLVDAFVGTTAQRVLRVAPVPVLVVRQAPLYPYEQVLVATDFSPAAAAAARAARGLFPGARLHALHVYERPYAGRLSMAGMSDDEIDDELRRAWERARQETEVFLREVELGGQPASVRVREGYPPARIKERAAELDADVIVLGAQGKSWLEAQFLGSVSQHVSAEAVCDVLVVQAPAETRPAQPADA